MRDHVPGHVYLIHFDQPYHHAKHYLGWTEGPIEERLACHASGQGAKLLAALKRAGIGWRLVHTWEGDRYLERKLKNIHNTPRLCPACQAAERAIVAPEVTDSEAKAA